MKRETGGEGAAGNRQEGEKGGGGGDGYPVPARRHRVESSVRRSRFIATIARVTDEARVEALVRSVRAEFPDATHHCWAFVAGPPGETARVGMSDDGEPHGTAGRPMLTTLLHSGVGELAVVVTRYFGGVKLGRGGLGRAYAGAVSEALEGLPTRIRVQRVEQWVEGEYPHVDALFRLLEEIGGVRLAEEFGAAVRFRVAVPESALNRLVRGVAEITGGTGRVEPVWPSRERLSAEERSSGYRSAEEPADGSGQSA